MALVAVVIPALNEEQTVADVVAAAQQARLVDEVIVVDNGSWDGTARAAATRARVAGPSQGRGHAGGRGGDGCRRNRVPRRRPRRPPPRTRRCPRRGCVRGGERFCIGPAFFQAIGHTGLGTYLTLQLAAVRSAKVWISGDLAMVLSRWSLEGAGSDGQQLRQAGTATDVIRRQADGTWRYVIDNPAGFEHAWVALVDGGAALSRPPHVS